MRQLTLVVGCSMHFIVTHTEFNETNLSSVEKEKKIQHNARVIEISQL